MPSTIAWYSNVHGAPSRIVTVPEGTSQTFSKGDLVIYDTSDDGVVIIADTAGVPDAQDFYGIALQDASGTDGTDIDVLVPQAGDLFEASLASAESTEVAPVRSAVTGQPYGLIQMTTGEYVVDNGNVNWVKVLGLHPADAQLRQSKTTLSAGDRVIFKFLESVLDNAGDVA